MSSYISPAPQGDDKATGAYAVAIAATPGGTNNNGHATDSAGNVVVDFAWGNFPLQPNDVRNASISNFGGERGSDVVTVITDGPMKSVPGEGSDYGWSATTMAASTALPYGNISKALNNGITFSVKPDSHELAEAAYSSYPSYASGTANYIVTAATGDGSTVTYTSMNWLKPGDVVSITGCPNSVFNLSSQTVVTATRQSFTVSNSAGSGVTVTGFYGKVQDPNAVSNTDGAYISGTAYVKVPSVLGLTTALAQDALNDAELTVTTASAATNSGITVTAANRASGGLAVLTASGAGAAFAIGTKVVITSVDASVNGTYTVVDKATNSVTVATTDTSALTLSGLSGLVKGLTGTIKTQSIAANANSISAGAAITITPWA